jgi:putative endonuclease
MHRQAGNRSFLFMYYVYVIKSEKDGRLYVGFTENLERRISEHNDGKTKSTKGYIPWILVYKEKCKTREDARDREKFLKSGIGKKIIKEYLQNLASYLPVGRHGSMDTCLPARELNAQAGRE